MSGAGSTGGPRIAVVFGTRPEIVKLAGTIEALGEAAWTIHTGQHWDHAMAGAFLDAFDLGAPEVELGLGGRSRGVQIGTATAALSDVFADTRPAVVVVQGDTNTALAGALAANACEIPLVHVEAGLRSFDRAMPEEHNRVVVDHLADRCCAPTPTSVANLRAEAIDPERIALTGNTVVEAVQRLRPAADEAAQITRGLGLDGPYAVATLHRPENVDGDRLVPILEALAATGLRTVLPLHPRTRSAIAARGLAHLLGPLDVIDPMGYRAFLAVVGAATVVISDSGGIQEEVTVLKRPCVVVRRSTERPEAMGTFCRLVAPEGIVAAVGATVSDGGLDERLAALASPFGDGLASRRCADEALALAGS